ncbi:MAG: hypothetical protein WCD16_12085, partial [Paracoccaceae bacterium]
MMRLSKLKLFLETFGFRTGGVKGMMALAITSRRRLPRGQRGGMTMAEMSGKSVLITGASRGIGAA